MQLYSISVCMEIDRPLRRRNEHISDVNDGKIREEVLLSAGLLVETKAPSGEGVKTKGGQGVNLQVEDNV